jgi:four helix bundle protein
MATIERFEDLKAWQKARELAREVYQLCESGALGNDFNLRNNLCRAATHCMSKIAEGYALRDRQLFAGQLDQARGAGVSVQSLLYVALDTHSLDKQEFQRLYDLANDAISLIGGLTSYLRR